MSLPIEIQDYIMLFCKGHERADFGIKTVALPVLHLFAFKMRKGGPNFHSFMPTKWAY